MTDRIALPLDASALPEFAGLVDTPRYDRAALRPSIVHIGVGGFHRAHLATYVDELCASGHTDWAIMGSGVLPSDAAMATTLAAQDTLYTLITRGAHDTTVRIIGSIVGYLLGSPDAEAVIAQIANPATQIVSLTVTEGGYPVDDSTGAYLPNSANAGPDSAFGILAAALERRRSAHGLPITIMSCDNIMHNGTVTQVATTGEAGRFGAELADWIRSSVSFPNSMVDRITPATTDADRRWLAEQHAIIDRWPVVTEPFRQWVVEDRFAGERPPLEELDIIVTDDVEPYELMKLRLLNAGHSCLAYLAALDGIRTVDVAMADPAIARFVRTFLERESTPVLPKVVGIDINRYNATLIERFSNPAIGDQIHRLCLDGSAKFPKFLLPTIRAQLNVNGPVGLAALALAGWCQYLIGVDMRGRSIELAPDPNLAEAVRHARRSVADPAAFLDLAIVFGADLGSSEPLRAAFVDALQRLRTDGVRRSIEAAIDNSDPAGGSGARPTR